MKHCPHCGAELDKNARFCPVCMTSLDQKQVIPTPKYVSLRWLSATAAVLVLALAVWSGLRWNPQEEQAAIAPPVTTGGTTTVTTASAATVTTTNTTANTPATTLTTAASTTLTTLAEIFSTTMTATTTATQTTTVSATTQTPTATTTSAVTTTTKTAAAELPQSGVWQDTDERIFNSGYTYEPTTWYWRAAGDALVCRGSDSNDNFDQTYKTSGVIIVGVEPNSTGCYRIPASIDGRSVVGLDMSSDYEGHQFNDPDIAPTVKSIVLPRFFVLLETNSINLCVNLESLKIAGGSIWMLPEALPKVADVIQNPYRYGPNWIYNLFIHCQDCTPLAFPDIKLLYNASYSNLSFADSYVYHARVYAFMDINKFY